MQLKLRMPFHCMEIQTLLVHSCFGVTMFLCLPLPGFFFITSCLCVRRAHGKSLGFRMNFNNQLFRWHLISIVIRSAQLTLLLVQTLYPSVQVSPWHFIKHKSVDPLQFSSFCVTTAQTPQNELGLGLMSFAWLRTVKQPLCTYVASLLAGCFSFAVDTGAIKRAPPVKYCYLLP